MRILLIKHGGPGKIRAILALQRLGEVWVADDDPGLPVPDLTLVRVPEVTAPAILNEVRGRGLVFDGVLTYLDPVVTVTARVAASLGSPGLDPGVADLLKDKLAMRQQLRAKGLPCPVFHAINAEADLGPAAEAVGFPSVLKPIGGAYSLGVRRVDSPAQLLPTYHAAAAELRRGQFARYFPANIPPGWLLERYLPGPEVSVELLGHPESPQALVVNEKPIRELVDGHFMELGFLSGPWQLSPAEIDRVGREAERLALGLGFTRGVANLDMRVGGDGPVLIELQATPAPGLVASMIERGLPGIDTLAIHARAHLQAAPFTMVVPPRRAATGLRILYGDRPGPFVLRGAEQARLVPGVYAVDIYQQQGVLVEPHSEYLGCISAEGADATTVQTVLDVAAARITIEPLEGP
jgi:hypothetical protein